MEAFSIHSEKLTFWIFRIIVYGLKTIGLAPMSLQTKTLTRNSRKTFINVFLYSKLGLFYNLVLSILTLLICAAQILNLVYVVYSNQSSLNQILDLVHYILIVLTVWSEIFYWVFRQQKAADIMNRLLDVHCLLSATEEKLSNKRMLIFLAMHMTFSFLVWIFFVVIAMISFKSLLTTVALSLPILVNYCFLVEYSMVLGYVAREFGSVNANLLTLKEFPNDSSPTFLPNYDSSVLVSATHNQLADVKLLHSARTTLYEVSQDVAEFFSLPILPSILLFFYMTVYNVYFIIIPVLLPHGDLSTTYHILIVIWLVIGLYPTILLCSYVTKTTKEAELTGHLVHKLLATARRREIITELEQFSLHLLHEKVSFSAHGFFTLDFTLLQSILGATTAYLVIIIQFALQSAKT